MSSSPLPVPRTAVPLGIEDPVEKARAELKAALAAIEVRANFPKRIERATDQWVTKGRAFARKKPVLATVAVIGAAVAVGGLVWSAVRAYTR